jgi:nicotinate dehydrogenase subunit B
MNAQDYLALNFTDITDVSQLYPQSRRDFMKRLGGGIIIFIALGELDLAPAQEGARPRNRPPGLPTDFNAFLQIDENGRVTLFTGKIEMGQGPITSLPQMLAEELDTPLDTVDAVMGDTDRCPWDMGTWGSMTTRFFGPPLRAAGAEARAVLIELAAEELKVPKEQLATANGAVFDTKNPDHRRTYGQLAKGQKIARHVDGKPSLKDPAQFKICGKPAVHRDGHDKVTGKAQYAGDIRLPGMLYARILRPPAHGATLKSVDVSAAKALPGVEIVQDGDFIAVLHPQYDLAEQALSKVKAEYNPSPLKTDDKNIFDHLLGVAPESRTVGQGGNIEDGRKAAAKKISSKFLNSYVAHSPMEPHTALAHLEDGKMTVWASTQNPFGARDEIARAAGLSNDKVRVITPFVGGGFGGKSHNLQAVEAARLAKATGKPVQVMWSREEEFFNDTFRPAAIVTIESGLDDAGKMLLWDYEVFYAGDRGSQHFYTVPNHRTRSAGSDWNAPRGSHPFGTGAWRAPGNNTNTFARESHIDITAVAAGMDPAEFRLKHLSDPRMIRVLKTAMEKFGYKPAKGPSKRGYGIACGTDAGAYVAAIAEVAVDPKTGKVQVKRVVCAQDMGVVINPEGATIQMEGCITMGLGYALTEEVHFKNGEVLDTNYDSYELPRFSWVPKMETILVEANDIPPQGGGEPAIILMGGLIANAIFDATGARMYQLPMTPERVLAALKQVG